MASQGAKSKSAFFAWSAAVFVGLMLLGFWSTYFRPLLLHRFSDTALTHIHGALFLSWPVLFLVQAVLAYRRRYRLHRALGLCGAVLAFAMVLSGVGVMSQSLHNWARQGMEEGGRATTVITFAGLFLFALFVGAALSNLRRPDCHKRFMYLATVAIMQGATGRIALMVATGGNPDMLRLGLMPPPAPLLPLAPHLLFVLIALGALGLADYRSLGRIHGVTWAGGAFMALILATRHLWAGTAAWSGITSLLLMI
jgi:hypothetical protein